MDPQATYQAWLESDSAHERMELRGAYNAWRRIDGFAAVDEDGNPVDRIPNDEVEGQDAARGILAVNPEEEGSNEWHAWALGYDNAIHTNGCYDEPLSGEWAGQMTPRALHRLISQQLDMDAEELDVDMLDAVDEAFELGYATWQGGWRV